MKCSQCECDKLSKEFLSTTITERCNHITSFCLGCLAEKLDLTNTTDNEIKCPECPEKLSQDEKEILSLAWNKALFKIDIGSIRSVKASQTNNTGEIHIVLLNGQKFTLQLNQINNILMLRQAIKKKLNIDEDKQKLIHNGVGLQDRKDDTTPNTLQDYNIGPGSHIQLIVKLYNITPAESVKNLTFDLFWGYPADKTDYLDGTCLLYKGAEHFMKYDYMSQFYPKFPHIKHSGDMMDDKNKKGHHCITAKLDELPIEVTQLYFILSSFISPTIGHFSSHHFELIDTTQPDKPLCTYKLEQAAHSQAVIMCCVSRADQGWEVFQIGKLSGGNANDYGPIEKSILGCSLY